jgi:hypothetical protein
MACMPLCGERKDPRNPEVDPGMLQVAYSVLQYCSVSTVHLLLVCILDYLYYELAVFSVSAKHRVVRAASPEERGSL